MPSFYSKKHFNIIKKRENEKKIINSGNYIMIMLTRSSKRTFNPSRYAGINVLH